MEDDTHYDSDDDNEAAVVVNDMINEGNPNMYELSQVLDHISNIDKYRDDTGRTWLADALCCGNMALANTFLDHRADPDITDMRGQSAVHYAAQEASPLMMERVLKMTKNIDAVDAAGNTPMHYALLFDSHLVRALIDAKCDLNIRDTTGSTPLHITVYHNIGQSLRILVEAGADQTIRNNNGQTPREYAIFYKRKDCADLLRTLPPGALTKSAAKRGRAPESSVDEEPAVKK